MKKIHIQYRSGLLIGLLSLSTLSSCVNTRREMVPSQARGAGNYKDRWNSFNIDRERENSSQRPGDFVVDLLGQMLGDINADQYKPFKQRGSAWQKAGTDALDDILVHATDHILDFDELRLSRSLYLLAKINTECKGLDEQKKETLENFYKEWFSSASALRDFHAQSLSNSIWALAKLNAYNRKLFHLGKANFIPHWLEKASALLGNNATNQSKEYIFNAQELSNSIWALAKLNEYNPEWLYLAREEERNRVKGFIQDWRRNASALLGNNANNQSKEYIFNAQELSNSIWALAKLHESKWLHVGIEEGEEFIPNWLRKAADLLGKNATNQSKKYTFNAQQLSNSICALAKLHESNPEWLHVAREEGENFISNWLIKASVFLGNKANNQHREYTFNAQSLSNSIWALAKLNAYNRKLFHLGKANFIPHWLEKASALLGNNATNQSKEYIFNAQELSNSIWALAKLHESNNDFLHLEREEVRNLVKEFIQGWLKKAADFLRNHSNTQNKKDTFNAQDLSNSICALAKLHECNREWLHLERGEVRNFISNWLIEASAFLGNEANNQPGKYTFNAQFLSNSIWALAKFNECNPKWLHLEKKEVGNLVKEFIQDWLIGVSDFLKKNSNTQNKKDAFNAQSLSSSIWALAKLHECNRESLHLERGEVGNFISNWLTEASDLLKKNSNTQNKKDAFNAQSLSNSIWALTKLHESNREWLHLAREEVGNFISNWLTEASDFFKKNSNTQNKKDAFNAQELSNSIWALATLHESNRDFLHLEREEVGNFISNWLTEASDFLGNNATNQSKKSSFNAQNLSNSIWALAKLHESNRYFLHLEREEVGNRVKGFISNWLRKASTLLGNEDNNQNNEDNIQNKKDAFNTQELSNSIWALAKLHECNAEWLHVGVEKFIQAWLSKASALLGDKHNPNTFNAQDLSNSIWALAKFNEYNPKWLHVEREEGGNLVKGFIQDWLREAAALLGNNANNQRREYIFNAQDLSNSIWVLVKLHEYIPESLYVEVEKIIQAWLPKASALLETFNAQNLSNSIWALAKFNEYNPGWLHVGAEKFIQDWLSKASALLETFNAQNLSNSIWALAKFNEYNLEWLHSEVEKFIQAWLPKASALLGDKHNPAAFNAQNLSNSICALAKLHAYTPESLYVGVEKFIQAWLPKASALLGTFNAQSLSNSIWALAKIHASNPGWLHVGVEKFIQGWLKKASALLGTFHAQNLSNSIWALAKFHEYTPEWLHVEVEKFIQGWLPKASALLGTFNEQDLSNSIWALAKMNQTNQSFIKEWVNAAKNHEIGSFNTLGLMQSTWALSKSNYWALSKSNYRDVDSMQQWTKGAIAQLRKFGEKELAKSIYNLDLPNEESIPELVPLLISKFKKKKQPNFFDSDQLVHSIVALSKLHYSDPNFMKLWKEKAKAKLQDFNANSLVKIICSLATLNHLDEPFIALWIQAAQAQLGKFSKQNLIDTIWTLAKLKYEDFCFIKKWTDYAKNKLDSFHFRELIKIIWALGKLNYNNPDSHFIDVWVEQACNKLVSCNTELLEENIAAFFLHKEAVPLFCRWVDERWSAKPKEKLSSRDLVQTIWALAKLNHNDPSFVKNWIKVAIGKINAFNVKDLVQSIWALATFNHHDATFMQQWIAQAESNFSQFATKDFIQILLAFGKFNYEVSESKNDNTPDFIKQCIQKVKGTLDYTQHIRILDLKGPKKYNKDNLEDNKDNLEDNKDNLDILQEVTQNFCNNTQDKLRTHTFNTRELSQVIWALAKLNHYDSKLIEAWVKEAKDALGEFNAQDLSQSIVALAKLDYYNKPFIQTWKEKVKEKMHQNGHFTTQNLSNSIWALAKLHVYDKKFIKAWCDCATQRLENFTAKDLTKSIWAFSKFPKNKGNAQKFIEKWIEQAKSRLQAFDLEEVIQHILALSNGSDSTDAIMDVDSMIHKHLAYKAQKEHYFTADSLVQIICSLAKLKYGDSPFIAEWTKTAGPRLSNFDAQGLAKSIWALAKLKYNDEAFIKGWVFYAGNKIAKFNAQDLTQSISALASFNFLNPAFMHKWLDQARKKLEEFDACTLVQSINTMDVFQNTQGNSAHLINIIKNWFTAIDNPQKETQGRNFFNEQSLTQVICALAKFKDAYKASDLGQINTFLHQWIIQAKCKISNFNVRQLLESTCALANLGIEEKDEEYKAFKAFIKALCSEAGQRLDQFSMQNLSRYMLALARLNHYDAVFVNKWLDMTKIRLPLYYTKDCIQSIWALSIWYDIEQRRDENQNMRNTKMYKIGMAIVNCLKQYSIIHLSQSICEAEVDDFKNSFLGYLFKINWLSLAAKKVANFNPKQLTQSIKALAILNDVGTREAFKAFDAYYVLFIKKWDERAQDSTFTEEEIRACLSALKRLRREDIEFYKEYNGYTSTEPTQASRNISW